MGRVELGMVTCQIDSARTQNESGTKTPSPLSFYRTVPARMNSRFVPGLTRMQADVLKYVRDRVARNERAPTLREIADAHGLKAKSGAHRVVEVLIDYGFLQRAGNALHVCAYETEVPELAVVERTIVKVVEKEVVRPPEAAHPPKDRAKTAITRRKRTYVLELEADLHQRLQLLSRQTGLPAERIIADAARDFVME